jgi:hypothetical protein
LRTAREADVDRALERLAAVGTPVRVGQYTLIEPNQDPASRLAQTQAVVARRKWEARVTTWDSTGMTDPALRPQMARLFTAIWDGQIHGIVAASRTDISTFDEVYESTLAAIRARGGFLTLARHETTF